MKHLILTFVVLIGTVAAIKVSSQSSIAIASDTREYAWLNNPDSAINWKEMDRTDRKDYMRLIVQPRMSALFKRFDEEKYPRIKCATCHGEGARSGEYNMPNPDLPKLPKNPAAFKKLSAKNPAMMTFMSDTVKPVMAKLLGMHENNPKTKSGFSCGNCHLYK